MWKDARRRHPRNGRLAIIMTAVELNDDVVCELGVGKFDKVIGWCDPDGNAIATPDLWIRFPPITECQLDYLKEK